MPVLRFVIFLILLVSVTGWILNHVETCDRVSSTNGSTYWENWAGTLHNHPYKIYCPQSLSEIVDIIQDVENVGKRIRSVGHAHSWSSFSLTDDILIASTNLDDISNPYKDNKGHWMVTIQSGVNVRQLDDFLGNHNPPLVTSGNVIPLSLLWGGITSTGSHGSGLNHHSVADFVVEMTLVLSNGTVVTFDNTTSGKYLKSARLALGLLGVIYSLTIRVEPAFNVKVQNLNIPWYKAFQANYIRNCVMFHDYCAMAWMPFNGKGPLSLDPLLSPTPMSAANEDMVWVRTHSRTNESLSLPNEIIDNQFNYAQIFYFNLFLDIGNITYQDLPNHPEYTPYFGFFTSKALNPLNKTTIEQQRYAQHYFGDTDGSLSMAVGTYTKLWDEGKNNWEKAETLLKHVVYTTYQEAHAGRYPLNQIMEIRYHKSSSSYLHPTYPRKVNDDPDILWIDIDFASYPGTPHFLDFTSKIVANWSHQHGTVPHWGSKFEHITNVTNHIRQELKWGIQKFNSVRKELDPYHRMGNFLTDQLFN